MIAMNKKGERTYVRERKITNFLIKSMFAELQKLILRIEERLDLAKFYTVSHRYE
mgnify:CR=1